MPARVREVSLTTRTARLKLVPRVKPYYRRLDADIHIGYYRPATRGLAGSWIARRYLGDQRYETLTVGTADDLPEVTADGVRILTFDQAQRAADDWKRRQVAAKRASESGETTLTVRSAVETYIVARKIRDSKAGRDAELRLSHHVLSAPLADRALLSLREGDLSDWRSALQRGGRTGKANKPPLAPRQSPGY